MIIVIVIVTVIVIVVVIDSGGPTFSSCDLDAHRLLSQTTFIVARSAVQYLLPRRPPPPDRHAALVLEGAGSTKNSLTQHFREIPMGRRIPPLRNNILLESNPLKSRILVRRSVLEGRVHGQRGDGRRVVGASYCTTFKKQENDDKNTNKQLNAHISLQHAVLLSMCYYII